MHLLFILLTFILSGETTLIFEGPANQAVELHSDVWFRCGVADSDGTNSSAQPFSIVWKFTSLEGSRKILYPAKQTRLSSAGGPPSRSSKYSVSARGYTLRLHDAEFSDAGNYSCTLNVTEQTETAILLVQDHPQCESPRRPLAHNAKISLNCSVHFAGIIPPYLLWYHGPDQLMAVVNTSEDTVSSTKILYLEHKNYNGHVFTCYIRYLEFSMTAYCQTSPLKVYLPANVTEIFLEPQNRENIYSRGDNIYLKCAAFGNPRPSYCWTYSSPDGRHVILSENSYYHIRNFQKGDEGNYSCKASNRIDGQSYTAEKQVQVKINGSGWKVHPPVRKDFQEKFSMQTVSIPHISPYAIGAIITSSLAVILIIVFIVLAVRLRAKERRIREKLARSHDENLDDQEVELLDENIQPCGDDLVGEYTDMRQGWEIPRRFIHLQDLIEKGIYTEVWKGKMRKYPSGDDTLRVAVKKLSDLASEKEKKFFMAEMEVLKMLPPHQYVIQLIGCYTYLEPHLILLEYASEGTLHTYLQQHCLGQQEIEITQGYNQAVRLRNHALTPQKMFTLCTQIIRGMEHLKRFKLICYRLTSSSVLVAKGGMCRLSAFGFSSDVTERNLYEAMSAPSRWMAPESLKKKIFDRPGDIWAFGVLLWEILHFGMMPYPTMGPQEVCGKVLAGYRMPQPAHCSAELYGLMLACWQSIPNNRPSLEEIHLLLKNLYRNYSDHIQFDKMPEYLKSTAYDCDSLETP